MYEGLIDPPEPVLNLHTCFPEWPQMDHHLYACGGDAGISRRFESQHQGTADIFFLSLDVFGPGFLPRRMPSISGLPGEVEVILHEALMQGLLSFWVGGQAFAGVFAQGGQHPVLPSAIPQAPLCATDQVVVFQRGQSCARFFHGHRAICLLRQDDVGDDAPQVGQPFCAAVRGDDIGCGCCCLGMRYWRYGRFSSSQSAHSDNTGEILSAAKISALPELPSSVAVLYGYHSLPTFCKQGEVDVVVAVVAGEGVCAELDGGEEGGEDNGRSEGAKLAVGEEKWWGGYGRFGVEMVVDMCFPFTSMELVIY